MFEAIDDIFQKISESSECSRALVTLTTAVGALVIFFYTIRIAYQLLQVLKLYAFSQYCCQRNLIKKYGQWAIITGATDGIGKAMAKELAGRGMSIIVIGRNDEKLADTKAMLERVPNVGEVETVRIDLSDGSEENFARIREQIDPENRDIGILINNAGFLPAKFTVFTRFDLDVMIQCLNVNVTAQMHLVHMIMPGMLRRGKGLVLNVSSMVGSIPSPFLSVYGPTKAFVDSFTRQLQMEYASHPIDIVLVTPGPVHTNMIKKRDDAKDIPSSLLVPSPEDFARSTLNALSAGVTIYSGTMLHGMIKELAKFTDSIGLLQYAFALNRLGNNERYDVRIKLD